MNMLKRASCIKKEKTEDPYAKSITLNANLGLNSIITSTNENLKAVINEVKNKFEMDCEEEIEEHHKACIESINKLTEKKHKEGFNLLIEINNIKWKERSMMELIFPEKGGKSIYIFNPLINKIENILIETEDEFPICYALCNKLPYCFVSGGKTKIGEEFVELNHFYTLRRTGEKNFEKIFLPNMLEEKTNHCLFEIPYLKSICALGGKNSREVEVFNLVEKTWENLPELNYVREGSSCCVINDTFVYCFFGYDTENCEYLPSIEKLDLEKKEEWEILEPYGTKSFMKRKFCGAIHYRQNFEEKVFIVGGVNVLNNESQDWFEYNVINNTIEKMESNLPYKSSFNCDSFIKLPGGLYSNLTSDFQLLQFESLGQYIFGIREKKF